MWCQSALFLRSWQIHPSDEEMILERTRPNRSDLFSRQPLLERRSRADRGEIRGDADTAGQEAQLGGFVAAAMLVAYADGNADLAERRRVIAQFRANPNFAGFSVEDLAEEMASHVRVFEYDPGAARSRAIELLRETAFSPRQILALLAACHDVISADGLIHPAELGALHLIGEVLGVDAPPAN